jgi:predicted small lipoprotein YifL
MTMNRSFHALVMTFALLLMAGCQNKGPTPKEGDPSTGVAPVGATDTESTHPAMGAQDPHAGMAPPQNPHGPGNGTGQPDASGMIDLGAIAFKVPPKWEAQQPKSSMRRAQAAASGSAGPAELIVFFFGPQGAGSTKDNIDRWVGQFSNPDGSPVSDAKQSTSKVSTFDVTRVEVVGQFAGGMAAAGQPQAPKGGQRLIAAIVETPDGPYYFKFLGPDATVAEHRGAFDDLIVSIAASP